MHKFKVIVVLLLLVMVCYSRKYYKCIKPGSRKRCISNNDCCFDYERDVYCFNHRCETSPRFRRGVECDYDIECNSKKCDMKHGKKVCI